MSNKTGKKFNKREVASSGDNAPAQANQWQASEQQLKWLNYYMNPREKETYANAYQAALKAGYSESYAARIMSPSLALEWVKSAKVIMRSMNTEHLKNILEDIASSNIEKASDRIAAVKLLGGEQGLFIPKQITAHVGLEEALAALDD